MAAGLGIYALKSRSSTTEEPAPKKLVALIGDVGGTNVRLTVRLLDLVARTSTEIKPLTKISPNDS